MAPSEAKQLTLDEAEFYLWDEKQVRQADVKIRKRLRGQAAKPEFMRKVTAAEYLRQLRVYYTGSEELDGG